MRHDTKYYTLLLSLCNERQSVCLTSSVHLTLLWHVPPVSPKRRPGNLIPYSCGLTSDGSINRLFAGLLLSPESWFLDCGRNRSPMVRQLLTAPWDPTCRGIWCARSAFAWDTQGLVSHFGVVAPKNSHSEKDGTVSVKSHCTPFISIHFLINNSILKSHKFSVHLH